MSKRPPLRQANVPPSSVGYSGSLFTVQEAKELLKKGGMPSLADGLLSELSTALNFSFLSGLHAQATLPHAPRPGAKREAFQKVVETGQAFLDALGLRESPEEILKMSSAQVAKSSPVLNSMIRHSKAFPSLLNLPIDHEWDVNRASIESKKYAIGAAHAVSFLMKCAEAARPPTSDRKPGPDPNFFKQSLYRELLLIHRKFWLEYPIIDQSRDDLPIVIWLGHLLRHVYDFTYRLDSENRDQLQKSVGQLAESDPGTQARDLAEELSELRRIEHMGR